MDKIIEIEEFDALPEEKKMINLYGIAYRTHQSVVALSEEVATIKSECQNTYTKKEQWINRGGFVGTLIATTIAILAYIFGGIAK